MNDYIFGNTSNQRLSSCHIDLQIIMREALKRSPMDFGIAEGHRSLDRQQQLYAEGKSKCDGIQNFSKHQPNPSIAVDVYPFINGRADWSPEAVIFLAGIILATAIDLKNRGVINTRIRWGGNWDGDGEILTDQEFDDGPHFELLFELL